MVDEVSVAEAVKCTASSKNTPRGKRRGEVVKLPLHQQANKKQQRLT